MWPSGALQDCLTEPTTFTYRLSVHHVGQAARRAE
jgi:hypothetical protein